MKFRGGEFPTGTTGNFQPELTLSPKPSKRSPITRRQLANPPDWQS